MANKMTNAIALTMAISTLSEMDFDTEALAKLGNIKASYEKRSATKSNKPTKTQIENEEIAARIVEILAGSEGMTVTEIIKSLDEEYSNQKISAIVNKIEKVEKFTEKRKSYFRIKA